MKISKQARREAKRIFRSTLMNGVMDPGEVRAAVQQLIEKKPRHYLATLEHLKRLVQLEENRRSARIESAVSLSPDQQSSITAQLQKLYGRGLNISFHQNPALVAGMRVRVGSDVYDGSVASRLALLAASF
jgi:F-type H+-transporting ATPase subunit delta